MKLSPRSEYREEQFRRTRLAAKLQEKFASLAALSIKYNYLNPDGSPRHREVKFTVNVERASAVVRVDCLNPDCVGGDFDLSDALAQAVHIRQREVSGELRCEGWQDRFSIDHVLCHQRIAFEIALEYQ